MLLSEKAVDGGHLFRSFVVSKNVSRPSRATDLLFKLALSLARSGGTAEGHGASALAITEKTCAERGGGQAGGEREKQRKAAE